MSELSLWTEKVQEVKAIFADNLTDAEFSIFVNIGKMLGLNPFTREIWAVKYQDRPAAIFVGRDGYRKKAQELEEYDGHRAMAVYSNDSFSLENGEPKHSFGAGDRGKLMGAYCVVYRKGCRVPFSVYVDFQEYNTGKSNWAKMPATMIAKVAEAQALRGAFQGIFAGTYSEAENWEDQTAEVVESAPKQQPKPAKAKEPLTLESPTWPKAVEAVATKQYSLEQVAAAKAITKEHLEQLRLEAEHLAAEIELSNQNNQ